MSIVNKACRFLLFACALLLLCFSSQSQVYSYTHYDADNGLAGSTVYCLEEDREGFLWIGTETGLSRFDGTRFVNFTTRQGLPDNEILRLFVDTRNRVWISAFKNSICYYAKGKIHNQENDPVLKRIAIRDNVRAVREDAHGNILIQEATVSHLLLQDGSVRSVPHNLQVLEAGQNASGDFRLVTSSPAAGVWLADLNWEGKVRNLRPLPGFPSNGNSYLLTPEFDVIRKGDSLYYQPMRGNAYQFSIPRNFIDMRRVNDSLLAINAGARCLLYNLRQRRYAGEYLAGHRVSGVLQDQEQNIWFTSMGKGLYRLSSSAFRNYSFVHDNASVAVFSLLGIDSTLYVGTDHSLLWQVSLPSSTQRSVNVGNETEHVRILSLLSDGRNQILLGSDAGIFAARIGSGGVMRIAKQPPGPLSVKQLLLLDTGLLVTATQGVFWQQRFPSKIWPDRATAAHPSPGGFYVGTLNGLYHLSSTGARFLGDTYPMLRARVSAISKDAGGRYWIATYGEGLVGIKDGQVDRHLRESDGLSSNIVRCLYVDTGSLWIGTDKGVSRIQWDGVRPSITRLTTTDGLSSNIIHTIYRHQGVVYVGTPEGITYFDDRQISQHSQCLLRLTALVNSGRRLQGDTTNFVLPHADNNLRFEFVGISYKSAGDVRYQYRLLGLDTAWQETRETAVAYPVLSSGRYAFEVRAINKFGVVSKTKTVSFEVEKLFVETTGFKILLGFAITGVLVLAGLVYRRFVQQKEAARSLQNKKLAETELKSLRAQMNPHFTFNVLNSIQYYLSHNDVASANRYLSRFAKLMRRILNNSTLSSISLADEIQTLEIYLELEKLRLGDRFSYRITAAEELPLQTVKLPSMLIQPYAENAIKHGFAERKKEALLLIRFSVEGEMLHCEISDNGIGRTRAKVLAERRNPLHVSTGMDLVRERIAAFNHYYGANLRSHVVDLYDEQGEAAGTKVTLSIPLWIH